MHSPDVGGGLKRWPKESEGKEKCSVLEPSVWEPLLDIFCV